MDDMGKLLGFDLPVQFIKASILLLQFVTAKQAESRCAHVHCMGTVFMRVSQGFINIHLYSSCWHYEQRETKLLRTMF